LKVEKNMRSEGGRLNRATLKGGMGAGVSAAQNDQFGATCEYSFSLMVIRLH